MTLGTKRFSTGMVSDAELLSTRMSGWLTCYECGLAPIAIDAYRLASCLGLNKYPRAASPGKTS
jgi:hypothetical protein